MWPLAEPGLPFPARDPHLPHDANARAGMRGHAGFGAFPEGLARCLERWVGAGLPGRMAVATARARRRPVGPGAAAGPHRQRAGSATLLAALPPGPAGVHVLVHEETRLSPAAPPLEGEPGAPSAFWFHLGYTGPALFVRPDTGLCLAVLAHRLGPAGELLDQEQLRARRWDVLARAVAQEG